MSLDKRINCASALLLHTQIVWMDKKQRDQSCQAPLGEIYMVDMCVLSVLMTVVTETTQHPRLDTPTTRYTY